MKYVLNFSLNKNFLHFEEFSEFLRIVSILKNFLNFEEFLKFWFIFWKNYEEWFEQKNWRHFEILINFGNFRPFQEFIKFLSMVADDFDPTRGLNYSSSFWVISAVLIEVKSVQIICLLENYDKKIFKKNHKKFQK